MMSFSSFASAAKSFPEFPSEAARHVCSTHATTQNHRVVRHRINDNNASPIAVTIFPARITCLTGSFGFYPHGEQHVHRRTEQRMIMPPPLRDVVVAQFFTAQ
jgi:hypothetical protein